MAQSYEKLSQIQKLKIVWYAWDKGFEAGNNERQGCESALNDTGHQWF